MPHNRLISLIYNELKLIRPQQVRAKDTDNPQEEIQLLNMKRCSTLLKIKETQTKTVLFFSLANSSPDDNTQCWQEGKMGTLILAGGSVNGHISGNHFVTTKRASTLFIFLNPIIPPLGIYPQEITGHWEKLHAQRFASVCNREELATAVINHGTTVHLLVGVHSHFKIKLVIKWGGIGGKTSKC